MPQAPKGDPPLEPSERESYIQAISRLMMLYDIGKVFHSTLDLSDLAPLILTRVESLLEADAAAVWLLDPVKRNLYCPAASGPTKARVEAMRVDSSDPGLAAALGSPDPLVLHDVEDPAWTERWGLSIGSLLAISLQQGGKFLGAIEALRAPGRKQFTEEEIQLLADVAKQASVALRNAQRLQAERRVNELHALMEISKEITATLDLDRVLAATVNRITTVIPLDRCSVSIVRRGKTELGAISGVEKVDREKPGVKDLEAFHTWQAGFGGDLSASKGESGMTAEPPEAAERVADYSTKSEMGAILALQLRDEEGLLGVLLLESKDPQALTTGYADLARIFANQVASAIRNALLYQQVPLIGVLQPLAQKKSKFSQLPQARQRLYMGAGVVGLLFLIFFPWWSKPTGDARVLPQRVLPISSDVAGTVERVLVNEGDRLQAGQIIAELDPQEQRVALEQAQTQRDILSRRALELESLGDLGEARATRARLEQAEAELALARTHVEDTTIRSPITGVVLTPRLSERVGQFLKRGEVFCQVADFDQAWVEIVVPEQDVGEIQPGQETWIKLNTYPTKRFDGKVIRVSPQGREVSGERVFDVVAQVPNAEGDLRAGMMGRGKVLAERRSVGYLILRVPGRWIWLKIWKWLP